MENAILDNKNIFDVSGKIILITGAGSGLGKGYSHIFAESGSTVICTDKNRDTVKITAEEIIKDGGNANAYFMDVTDNDYVKSMVEEFVREYGRIDVLINNAGEEYPQLFLEYEQEPFDLILDTNLRGSYFTAQAVAKKMATSGGGKIINISSLAGHTGLVECSAYTASKAGVRLFTKVLAYELAKHNIQVNSISPGFFLTPMTQPFFNTTEKQKSIRDSIAIGRPGNVRDLAGTVLFLASSASDYLTGTDIIVDGGWMAR